MRYPTLAILALLAAPAPAPADETGEISGLLNLCSLDLKTFCSTVTPAPGRLLSCIAAHQDQVSAPCLSALYDRTDDLAAYANTIQFVGVACARDIDEHCGNVEPGEGRMTVCLANPELDVTPECAKALEGIGLRN